MKKSRRKGFTFARKVFPKEKDFDFFKIFQKQRIENYFDHPYGQPEFYIDWLISGHVVLIFFEFIFLA